MVSRPKDGSTWRIGTDAEVAWIADSTFTGLTITAAIPPGDEAYFRLAMDVAQRYSPLDSKEEQVLLSQASNVQPIFHRGNDV